MSATPDGLNSPGEHRPNPPLTPPLQGGESPSRSLSVNTPAPFASSREKSGSREAREAAKRPGAISNPAPQTSELRAEGTMHQKMYCIHAPAGMENVSVRQS